MAVGPAVGDPTPGIDAGCPGQHNPADRLASNLAAGADDPYAVAEREAMADD